MIIDNLRNAQRYYGIGKRFAAAFDFLKTAGIDQLSPGRYEICGSEIYATISEYETIDIADGRAEGHRRYADIQYIIAGTERIGFLNVEACIPVGEYDEAHDIGFFEGKLEFVTFHSEDFAIVFPEDIHMPRCRNEQAGQVKKAVIKVLLD